MPSNHRVNPRTFRFALEGVVTGTSQASTTSTLKLAAGDAAADDFYNGMLAVITVQGTGGPPIGQRALITNYVSSTKIATIICLNNPTGLWTAAPAADSQYAIHAVLTADAVIGTAQAGAGNTIRSIILADKENTRDGWFKGLDIEIVGGTGAAVGRKSGIMQYVGSSRLVSVDGAFAAIPDATSVYRIQGHLYTPVTGLLAAETSGGAVLRFACLPGRLALGAYTKGTQVDETDLADWSYLELAMDGAASTVEITRWE